MLDLLGNWSAPVQSADISALQAAIERYGCTCQYCGTTTHLSPKAPLGHFVVVVSDHRLPSEPANWVPLCKMCAQLNDLDNLEGKGSFIEAPWVSQSRLTNIIRLSYSISLSPDQEWGDLKEASTRFLIAIDSAPKEWTALGWKGDPASLKQVLENSPFPYSNRSYLQGLRFRFDLEPFKEEVSYWSPSLQQSASLHLGEGN